MYDCCILVCTTFRCRDFPKKPESTFLLMVVVIIKGNVCVSDRFVTKNCEKINREVREVHFWGTLLRRLGAWPRASGCVYFFGWSPSARAKLSGRLIEKRAKSSSLPLRRIFSSQQQPDFVVLRREEVVADAGHDDHDGERHVHVEPQSRAMQGRDGKKFERRRQPNSVSIPGMDLRRCRRACRKRWCHRRRRRR